MMRDEGAGAAGAAGNEERGAPPDKGGVPDTRCVAPARSPLDNADAAADSAMRAMRATRATERSPTMCIHSSPRARPSRADRPARRRRPRARRRAPTPRSRARWMPTRGRARSRRLRERSRSTSRSSTRWQGNTLTFHAAVAIRRARLRAADLRRRLRVGAHRRGQGGAHGRRSRTWRSRTPSSRRIPTA